MCVRGCVKCPFQAKTYAKKLAACSSAAADAVAVFVGHQTRLLDWWHKQRMNNARGWSNFH